MKLPIQSSLLELLLFELQQVYGSSPSTALQPYLGILFRTIFLLGYYGLFRIGELAYTNQTMHTIKTCNVHVAKNKDKLMVILYSSKTHLKDSRPQEVKIRCTKELVDSPRSGVQNYTHITNRFFCPFVMVHQYVLERGHYNSNNEPWFIFRDGTPVSANTICTVLRTLLVNLGLDLTLYDTHSLCIGHASDMFYKLNYTLDEIKQAGRWHSNIVYRYLRGI